MLLGAHPQNSKYGSAWVKRFNLVMMDLVGSKDKLRIFVSRRNCPWGNFKSPRKNSSFFSEAASLPTERDDCFSWKSDCSERQRHKRKVLGEVVPFSWVSFCGLKGVQEHVAQRQQGWHFMFTGWPSFVLWHLTTCSCGAFSIIRRARTTTVHGSTIASDSTTGSSSSSCCPMCTLDLAVVCRS